jgi:hypothetical protein
MGDLTHISLYCCLYSVREACHDTYLDEVCLAYCNTGTNQNQFPCSNADTCSNANTYPHSQSPGLQRKDPGIG